MSPDFSVVIPTFRRNAELREAIDSALSQTGVSAEVIVVDDSPEAAARVVVDAMADARVQFMHRRVPSDRHPSRVRNDGLRQAQGKFIHFLDDDDLALPGALMAMKSAFEQRPGAGVAIGRVVCFGPNDAVVAQQQARYDWAARTSQQVAFSRWLTIGISMFRAPLLLNSGCAIRRECALAVGGYDEDMAYCEDLDFFVRAIRRFGHVVVPHDVLHYRVAGASMLRDLQGNMAPVVQGFHHLHARYKRERGQLEYRLLQLMAKSLPIPVPRP